jgi:hypothetical protein
MQMPTENGTMAVDWRDSVTIFDDHLVVVVVDFQSKLSDRIVQFVELSARVLGELFDAFLDCKKSNNLSNI